MGGEGGRHSGSMWCLHTATREEEGECEEELEKSEIEREEGTKGRRE